MKKLCLKFISYSFALLGLVLLFVPLFQASATNQISITNTADGLSYIQDPSSSRYQTFTAVHNNITGFELYMDGSTGYRNIQNATICEIGYIGSNVCIDDPVDLPDSPLPSSTGYVWHTITFDPIDTNIGSFYMISWDTATNDATWLHWYYTQGDYTGGTEYPDGGGGVYDYVFQTYYDDAYIPNNGITGSIYWAGVGTQYGLIGGYWNIPVYYNVCSSYGDIKYAYLTIGYSNNSYGFTPVIEDKTTFIGPQRCSGIVNIDSAILETENINEDYELVLHIGDFDVVTEEDEVLVTSTMPVIINTGVSAINYLDAVMPVTQNLKTNQGTTTLLFNYDFTNLAWQDGQVCIFDLQTQHVTEFCTDIDTEIDLGNMILPNITQPQQLDGEYRLYSSTTIEIFKSAPWRINWVINDVPNTDEYICTPPTLDTSHACDSSILFMFKCLINKPSN